MLECLRGIASAIQADVNEYYRRSPQKTKIEKIDLYFYSMVFLIVLEGVMI